MILSFCSKLFELPLWNSLITIELISMKSEWLAVKITDGIGRLKTCTDELSDFVI